MKRQECVNVLSATFKKVLAERDNLLGFVEELVTLPPEIYRAPATADPRDRGYDMMEAPGDSKISA